MITFHQGESLLGAIKCLLSKFNATKREININWLSVIKGNKTHQPNVLAPLSLGDGYLLNQSSLLLQLPPSQR